ncbi:MAG: GtrA family protein, partial [Clostridiales bacterium]
MKIANQLYQKFMAQDAQGQFLRFLFVGVLNTIVGYGSYWIGIKFGIHFAIASLIGQILGTVHSYIWNKKFTFASKTESPGKTLGEMVRFSSVYAVQYVANVALIAIFIKVFSLSAELGGFFAMAICTVI